MGRLEGKVAIITGAGGGQGKEEALLFAKEGAKVVATDIDEDSVKEVVEEINSNNGEAISIPHDVSSEEDWLTVKDETLSTYSTIDILVNNAGIIGDQVPFEEIPMDTWDTVMDINAKGPFLGMKTVSDVMKDKKKGSIINISSVVAHMGIGDNANYTASKGAVNALTKQVGQELGSHGIRVNSINPGFVDTAMIADLTEDERKEVADTISLYREHTKFTESKDVAYAALFLASDEASNIHGAEIAVDGGYGSIRT